MKTFRQFVENYVDKMALARQRQLGHLAQVKQTSQNAVNDMQAKRDAEEDRKQLKKEIKKEIQQGDYN